jgi:hypothetical protein
MPKSDRSAARSLSALCFVSVIIALSPVHTGCRDSSKAEQDDDDRAARKRAERRAKAKKSAASACEIWAKTTCRRDEECRPIGRGRSHKMDDECEEMRVRYCELEGKLPGAPPPQEGRAACASALESLSCREYMSDKLVPECDLRGSLKAGEPCTLSGQCRSGWCDRAFGKLCGECASPPQEGESCLHYTCSIGLRCDAKGVCRKPVARGASCHYDTDCTSPLVCVRPGFDDGKCDDPRHEGESCRDIFGDTTAPAPSPSPTDAGSAAGLMVWHACDHTLDLECIHGVCGYSKLKEPGDACEKFDRCRNGYCDASKCVLAQKPGTKCDIKEPRCEWPGMCNNGKCELPSASWCAKAATPDAGADAEIAY